MSRSSRLSLTPANVRGRRASTEERRDSAALPPNRVTKPPRSTAAPAPEHVPLPAVTGPIDPVLAVLMMMLIAFGIVMVYSASSVTALKEYGDGYFYLKRQSRFALVALPVMFSAALFDYHRLPKYWMLLGSLAVLCLMLLGFGHRAGGAVRWIRLGGVGVQPGEFAKVAFIVWLAWSMSCKPTRMKTFSVGLLPHLCGVVPLAALFLAQPDFGSAVMITAIALLMLVAAGAHIPYLIGSGVVLALVALQQLVSKEYRMRRILAFFAPEEHRAGAAYQLMASHRGFGSGGFLGVGIGDSKQKLLSLPEAHTDFIGSIVAEELGLLGFALLTIAFGVLVWRGLRAAFRSVDDYGFYLATGLTLLIGAQALTNLAVVVGLIPTKGLVLPFISAGGSSLLASSLAMGIVLNVSRPRVAPDALAAGARPSREPRKPARRRESMAEGSVGGVA